MWQAHVQVIVRQANKANAADIMLITKSGIKNLVKNNISTTITTNVIIEQTGIDFIWSMSIFLNLPFFNVFKLYNFIFTPSLYYCSILF